ncbi:SusC/RagA family TonB-linked outer membrane protein [Sphingobacterium sp. SYP-B4668]|uniref:SusC/RagA family TonB-linked outer membrane protein n=1 Tax=Sphingobacterium sp. SYP-B4668 TaxID=2996035 RepID=UPI0022DDD259|nr:SusC/RagA family TonB-linked outer membrane protein [Sphingobacterium sp. SYP-B4668]
MKFYLSKKSKSFSYKILIMTKLTILLIIGTILQVQAKTLAQKITLLERNSSLEQIISKISKQSRYEFVYSSPMLKDTKNVNIEVKNADINTVLDLCFANQPVAYSIVDNTVVVKRKEDSVPVELLQQSLVKGVVRNATGNPLGGVSIKVKGGNVATVSNSGGEFELRNVPSDAIILFSYLGYASQEITLANRSSLSVTLHEQVQQLTDVVVTALGIKRQKRELGYAVSDVSSTDISGFGETNAIASLAGKIAGVNISTTTAGPTGSSRVVIRGIRELQGSNQPLYVIDGVPAVNGNIGSADHNGGFDLGDGVADINPNDIENISVLKGASAALLYGSRALNGVILITTKSGKGQKGIGVDFNSSLTTDHISTKLEEVQKIYGQGNNGLAQRNASEASNIAANWGPRYTDLDSIIQRNGQMRPYKYIEDNIQNFFRTGVTAMNTLSLSGGNERSNLRFSYSNVANKDIVPSGKFDRNTFSLRGETKLVDKLTLEVKASLMQEDVKNRPALTDDVNNIGNGLIGIAGNFDQAWLQEYQNEDGSYINYTGNQYRANPYWTLNRTKNDSDKRRIGGSARLNYEMNEFLNFSVSGGTDFYNFKFRNFYDRNTPTRDGGQLILNDLFVREDNYQAMVNFRKELTPSFRLGAMLGGNVMKFNRDQTLTTGTEINVPGKDLITNFKELKVLPANPRKEIQSIFGNVELGYNNYLFLNLQARNDWSSTLPKGNNSYFYPAADLSFVLSDALALNSSVLNYAKLRSSVGQVGSDADPYKTRFLYSLTGTAMNGMPMGEVLGETIPNAQLRPQRKTSVEFGADLSFFNNRLGLDFTYYDEVTNDVLIDLPIPQTTGYSFASLNAAKLKNRGVEILLKGTPIVLENSFRWNLAVNFSKNYNTVVDLYEDLDAYTVAEARWAGATIIAEKGKPFGTILGNGFALDEQGRRIHGKDGMPLYTDAPVEIGNSLPKWTGGLVNSFLYKGFELKAVLDVRKGGSLFSMTNMTMHINGSHPNTAGGRDSWNEYSAERRAAEQANQDPDQVAQNGRGYVGEGVNEAGEKNEVAVNPTVYWAVVGNNIPQPFIYDGGYVKLRDIGISYTIPTKFLKGLAIQQASIGIIGRNLWIIQKNVPNIDPESNYNNGNGQGFEYGSLPGRKSIGFNLQVKF